MVLYGYLPAPPHQSCDAANPGTTQPDKLEERALRFVVSFVQLTNTINGNSRKCAHVQTQHTLVSYTVCTTASSELPSTLARRPAVHLTTKRQILYLHTRTRTHKHTHTRTRKRRAATHYTALKLQPNALAHAHKSSHYALHKPNKLPISLFNYTEHKIWRRRLFGGCVLLGTTFYTMRENKS
jgi:hypothetical protein